MPAPKKSTPRKRIVVHLGGVGLPGEKQLAKTREYAKRFPNVKFKSVDLKKYTGPKIKNVETRVADFKEGLEFETDGTVDVISSELALGHHGAAYKTPKDHTFETFQVALKKLRKGGKLIFVMDALMRTEIRKQLITAGFSPEKITIRRLKTIERQRTHWTRNYKGFLYQTTAVK